MAAPRLAADIENVSNVRSGVPNEQRSDHFFLVVCFVMGNSSPGRDSPESKFFEPTGLYASCAWDVKEVKRLIGKRKLAPRWPGVDGKTKEAPEECPICFLVSVCV